MVFVPGRLHNAHVYHRRRLSVTARIEDRELWPAGHLSPTELGVCDDRRRPCADGAAVTIRSGSSQDKHSKIRAIAKAPVDQASKDSWRTCVLHHLYQVLVPSRPSLCLL
ncbi:uncharacterized protein STEHIDRAFT_120121 [Stereum hirsutum FP-91666 SS1]|uniref:uncharacterized protein n=1 Tax=Stereum hirsutum (strain FP-91666) TaxID=721885 RepID=UPI000440FF76|nr:uncharacterized protein STEHIDRAFT_120121 [Stereum hirsutum FP-91666 SS1]EIM87850.1 hypothetical protein STEHIDRAFT_120121 [Stereum hirsutum FP-91666 SS1]